jgi:hypothetical protein
MIVAFLLLISCELAGEVVREAFNLPIPGGCGQKEHPDHSKSNLVVLADCEPTSALGTF